MAGKGRAPKPANRLAGHGAAKARNEETRWVESAPVPQPALPDCMPNGEPWPQQTVLWWEEWGGDPLAASFRPSDWSSLLDTAALHGAFWSGELRWAAELRLRLAKFGATEEDRARLRIKFHPPAPEEVRQATGRLSARERARMVERLDVAPVRDWRNGRVAGE